MHGVQDHQSDRVEARIVRLPVELFHQDEIAVVEGVMECLNAADGIFAHHLVDQFALAGRHVQGNQ